MGSNDGDSVRTSFWDTQTSYQNSSAGGTGKTTAEMKTKATFPDAVWDFTNTWAIDPTINNGYPRLRIFGHPLPIDSEDPVAGLPKKLELSQNYPNPFNPTTTIKYALPKKTRVQLDVFDVLGRRVQTLVDNEAKPAGHYHIQFNASRLASGVYFYRLVTGNKALIKKMILIK